MRCQVSSTGMVLTFTFIFNTMVFFFLSQHPELRIAFRFWEIINVQNVAIVNKLYS